MRISEIKLVFGFVCLLFFSGCSMYTPLNHSPTEFTEKHDVHASASISFFGYNAFAAYTPINHFFIYGEGNLSTYQDNNLYHKSYSAGIGGYHVFNDCFFLELRAGYGQGKFEYADQNNGSNGALTLGDGSYIRYYGSFSIMYKNNMKAFGFFINTGGLDNTYTYTNINLSSYGETMHFVSVYSGFIFKKYFNSRWAIIHSLGANIPYYKGGINDNIFRVNELYSNLGITFNLKKS